MTGQPIRPVGDLALIVDLPGLEAVLALAAGLRSAPPAGVVDIVPAARTVLLTFRDAAGVRAGKSAVESLLARSTAEAGDGPRSSSGGARDGRTPIEIPTVYDGPDLAELEAIVGLSREGIVAAHAGSEWRAAFGGFAPGFAYLTGGDPVLRVPRLASPRTAVPAGSVAIAGEFSAVYPGESPGGWRLLGRTDARLFDPSRDPAALIAPGDLVRFVPVREFVRVGAPGAGSTATPAAHTAQATQPALTVMHPGMRALVQDLGRPGAAAVGVTASGAMDRAALARANRAVGNAEGAAAIEALNGGVELRAERRTTVAVAGAECAIAVLGAEAGAPARPSAPGAAIELAPGERLRLGPATAGLRAYIAVRGGIAGNAELGSLAHDSLSGLGAPPLAAGQGIAAGDAAAAPDPEPGPDPDPGPEPLPEPEPLPAPGEATVLRFVAGPRDDWFDVPSRERLRAQEWEVTAESNRIGIRLGAPPGGAALTRERAGELATEGTVRGALQVPPSGLPVLFLADHPVTGGYPVIGVVVDADLDLAGQLRPGDAVRFEEVDPARIPRRARRAAAPERPETVRFSIEVDGRRHALALPFALAAALERQLAAENDRDLLALLRPIVEELATSNR
ncbi:carboxyltransferase domain-containing protein [Leucobacter luti]|uniref:5-oxoprolinase subunit B/C family protein n=1 Tax=Leucobacter luti TaxID=340320 RepID=UPI003D062C8A